MLVPVVAAGCSSEPPPDATGFVFREVGGEAFGAGWVARWAEAADRDSSRSVEERAEAALAAIDASVSTWRDDSEISIARRTPGRNRISTHTSQILSISLDLARRSQGAFEPTVLPLMELWGFQGKGREVAPSDAEVAEALAKVGWARVESGVDEGSTWVDLHGTSLDLAAVAPGYAADVIHDELSELGLSSIYVDVGGEIRISGPGPRGPTWRVGVDYPATEAVSGQDLAFVVELTNAAVATSGNYRNRRIVDGQAVGHTMDARLGRPVSTTVASATVAAPTAALADGLATTLMVVGPERAPSILGQYPGVSAWLLVSDGPERLRVWSHGGPRVIQVVDSRISSTP